MTPNQYSLLRDYFEEPDSNNDVVLKFDFTTSIQVTCILETEIATLGLVPPSTRIGITYGKVFDLVKVYVPAGRGSGDTPSLFTGSSSQLPTIMKDSIRGSFGKAGATAIPGFTPGAVMAGKVVRVDYVPLSDGSALAGAVVTFLLYV